jgi:hypothetical protein
MCKAVSYVHVFCAGSLTYLRQLVQEVSMQMGPLKYILGPGSFNSCCATLLDIQFNQASRPQNEIEIPATLGSHSRMA